MQGTHEDNCKVLPVTGCKLGSQGSHSFTQQVSSAHDSASPALSPDHTALDKTIADFRGTGGRKVQYVRCRLLTVLEGNIKEGKRVKGTRQVSRFEGVTWCDMMTLELKFESRKGNLEPGKPRKGGWGDADQITKGLERQGEEFGLDSVSGSQLPKSFERRRDMTRASGRTGQNWRLRPEAGVAVVQVGDDDDDDDRAWTQVVVGAGEEEGQMPLYFLLLLEPSCLR